MSSRYESYSLVTAEALAHGLPVVGFADCPGVNQLVIDGRNGVLAKPGADRVLSLASALRLLMENADLRHKLSEECGRIPADASLERVLDSWEALLYSVRTKKVGNHRGGPQERNRGPESD